MTSPNDEFPLTGRQSTVDLQAELDGVYSLVALFASQLRSSLSWSHASAAECSSLSSACFDAERRLEPEGGRAGMRSFESRYSVLKRFLSIVATNWGSIHSAHSPCEASFAASPSPSRRLLEEPVGMAPVEPRRSSTPRRSSPMMQFVDFHLLEANEEQARSRIYDLQNSTLCQLAMVFGSATLRLAAVEHATPAFRCATDEDVLSERIRQRSESVSLDSPLVEMPSAVTPTRFRLSSSRCLTPNDSLVDEKSVWSRERRPVRRAQSPASWTPPRQRIHPAPASGPNSANSSISFALARALLERQRSFEDAPSGLLYPGSDEKGRHSATPRRRASTPAQNHWVP